ncbi:MAG: hypothetical protein AABX61_01025 [Nanoarchaeota archaeon]
MSKEVEINWISNDNKLYLTQGNFDEIINYLNNKNNIENRDIFQNSQYYCGLRDIKNKIVGYFRQLPNLNGYTYISKEELKEFLRSEERRIKDLKGHCSEEMIEQMENAFSNLEKMLRTNHIQTNVPVEINSL